MPKLDGHLRTVASHPPPSFSATLCAHLDDRPGAFAALAAAIGEAGRLLGGIELPLKTREDLSMTYTPGVPRVIADDPEKVWNLTVKPAVAAAADEIGVARRRRTPALSGSGALCEDRS